ncbi:MAG TPA: MDR family MFS transporter [Candidatus Binataceae bacterium]|nr:MDR family MFS transporter [Candidatus Binataceae bacterium]
MEAVQTLAAPVDAPANTHKWLIAIAVMLGCILELLDTTIVNVSLPHMQGSFSASVDEITWVVTSYLVANGIMIPLTGWISGRFGRKRYFLFSVSTFVLASACCGLAQTLDQIVLFRLLQGFAGAAMQPSSQAIMMETFPPEEQQMAMATWSMGISVAPVLGPTIGGWITDNWSWRWTFYINVPIGLIAIVMVSLFLHDPPYLKRLNQRIDYFGIMLLTLTLGLTQLVADRGQRADWFGSPWVVYASVSALTAGVIFVWHELRSNAPVLELRIFAIPLFTAATVLMVLMAFLVYGTSLMNPIFLQEFLGYTAWKAGLMMAPRSIGSIVVLIFIGQIARRGVNTRPFIVLGFAIIAISLWQMAKWNHDVGPWNIAIPIFINGLGTGFIFAQLAAISLATVDRERMGAAASLFNMTRNTGGSIGISVITTLFVTHQQINQSYLAEHISVFDVWKLAHGVPRMPGSPAFSLFNLAGGHSTSLASLYAQVQSQAAMLAFSDVYRILMVVTLLMIPTFFLIRHAPMSVGGPPME